LHEFLSPPEITLPYGVEQHGVLLPNGVLYSSVREKVPARDEDRSADGSHELAQGGHPGALDHPVVETGVCVDNPHVISGRNRRLRLIERRRHELDVGLGGQARGALRDEPLQRRATDVKIDEFLLRRIGNHPLRSPGHQQPFSLQL
jgi:hypothetical protein